MINTVFEKYDAYKDSEIMWLGELPAHWRLSRIKNFTGTQSGTTPKSDVSDYYDDGTHYWVRTTDLNNGRLSSSEFKVTDLAISHYNLSLIPVKSVLLAMYGGMGTIGKNAILQEAVTINQSVCAILPNKKNFNPTYLWYYTQYFRPHWELFANSARKDPNINQEAIKRLWIPLPFLPEQEEIAVYLDEKTAVIDQKISLFTQKEARYKELKQALINETVTGKRRVVENGELKMDNSPFSTTHYPLYKDSGIPWLGKIPAHWSLQRIKDLSFLKSGDSIIAEKIEESGRYPIYGGNGLRGYCSKFTNNGNHILIGRQGALCGNVNYTFGKFWATEHAVVVYSKPFINVKWYGEMLRVMNLNQYSLSAAQPGLSIDKIKRLLLPVPPLSEQKAIADYLDTKTAHIDRIVETIHNQIEQLQELRKTLINDVVTGKIKVIEN